MIMREFYIIQAKEKAFRVLEPQSFIKFSRVVYHIKPRDYISPYYFCIPLKVKRVP